MEIIDTTIEKYLNGLLPDRDGVLQQMEDYGYKKDFPIIGPLVGRLLLQLATLTQARRIFELGSGYGYSAMWFSKGVQPGAKIICTDGSQENAVMARGFFKQAGIETLVDFRVGDALTLLDKESGSFDVILNDIDKHEYPEAFRKAVPRLRKGGLLVTDNVLWSGKVVSDHRDRDTKGILDFNQLAYQSKEVHTVIIPLRDGVAVSMKL